MGSRRFSTRTASSARRGCAPTGPAPGWAGRRCTCRRQREQPYRAAFDGAASHLVILHRSAPGTVRRGHLGLHQSRTVPPGGFFVRPAGKDLTVELGGVPDTVHVYLSDNALQCAYDGRSVQCAYDGGSVDPVEELGVVVALMEQLVLALDGVLQR